MLKKTVVCRSLEETNELARDLAKKLSRPGLVELVGDLGAGKTTFIKGLVAALGKVAASSPSFTVENVYQLASGPISHFDFYRLDEAGVLAPQLAEALDDQQRLVFIEWGKLVEDQLPSKRLMIFFSFLKEENHRQLDFLTPPELSHLLPKDKLI